MLNFLLQGNKTNINCLLDNETVSSSSQNESLSFSSSANGDNLATTYTDTTSPTSTLTSAYEEPECSIVHNSLSFYFYFFCQNLFWISAHLFDTPPFVGTLAQINAEDNYQLGSRIHSYPGTSQPESIHAAQHVDGGLSSSYNLLQSLGIFFYSIAPSLF